MNNQRKTSLNRFALENGNHRSHIYCGFCTDVMRNAILQHIIFIDSVWKASWILLAAITLHVEVFAQRYFEFGNRFYRDGENFVAVTSDSAELLVIESQLSLPDSFRNRHITGILSHGNPGYNLQWHWHFAPNQWHVVETSIEVCDGLPSSVERDTAVWIDGYPFCPWASYLLREVPPTSVVEHDAARMRLTLYPNPSKGVFDISLSDPMGGRTSIAIYNIIGQAIYSRAFLVVDPGRIHIDISEFPPGMYFFRMQSANRILTQRLLKL